MGLKLLTNMDAQLCLKLAWRTAQDLGYSLTPLGDCAKRFTASKGNIVLGRWPGRWRRTASSRSRWNRIPTPTS